MKLFTAILSFIMLVGIYLGLIYVFNYVLVQEDALLYDMISSDFLPVYRLLNMLWTAIPFLVIFASLINNISEEERLGWMGLEHL